MPIFTIKIPHERIHGVDIKSLTNDVKLAISQIPKLEAKPEHVSVFVPYDLCVVDKVIVEILIYDKPSRTEDVIHEMSSKLKKFLEAIYFPDVPVGVAVVVLNPNHCVSSHD